MTTKTDTPLTLLGPGALYRFAYFASRYAGAAVAGAMIVIEIAFVRLVFDRLGVVGGLVITVSEMLAAFVLIRFILQEGKLSIRHGFIAMKKLRGHVVVTSAHDVHLNKDVMLSCHNRVITIHDTAGEQRDVPFWMLKTVAFEDTRPFIMKLLLETGEELQFALSPDAVPLWRETLTSATQYGSATAG
jgi:hypothetical protein